MKHLVESKVKLFLEGHKILRNLPYSLDVYWVNLQTMRKIFVAFSEKLNFKVHIFWEGHKILQNLPLTFD